MTVDDFSEIPVLKFCTDFVFLVSNSHGRCFFNSKDFKVNGCDRPEARAEVTKLSTETCKKSNYFVSVLQNHFVLISHSRKKRCRCLSAESNAVDLVSPYQSEAIYYRQFATRRCLCVTSAQLGLFNGNHEVLKFLCHIGNCCLRLNESICLHYEHRISKRLDTTTEYQIC